MLAAVDNLVHCDCGPVRPVGMRITSTMTVLRLGDGTLLVHSPLPLTAQRRAEVCALGQVTHLYAPNTFHHQWLSEWTAAFPKALVHAPSELHIKRPDLRIDRFHDQSDDAPFDGVDEVRIRGFRLRETALIHRAARTAIVADLVSNIGRPEHTWTMLYSRAMGFYDRVALSRLLRWTSFDDRGAARISVNALLAHPFDTLVVGHGSAIPSGAREVLASATAWLPDTAPRLLEQGTARTTRWRPRPCG
jgi:hypothetical protein